MNWLEKERAWFSPKRELTRLKRRARARWLIVVGVSLFMAAMAMRKLSKPPGIFTARVIIKISESDLLRDRSPIVGRGLASYLLDATLRTDDLAVLLKRNGLYVDAIEQNKSVAAMEFRDELEVEVYRNYFAVERGYSGGARTARISIRYSDDDPERAMTVVREVAELMATTEAENRRRAAVNVAAIGRVASDAAETRLDKLYQRQLESIAELERMKDNKSPAGAALRVEIRGLSKAIDFQNIRLRKARSQLESIELREAAIGRQLGVDFQIVDERPPEITAGLGGAMLGMVGIVVFLIMFPLAGIGIGAFDVRVHDGDDARRLGLPVLGQLDS